MMINKNPNKIDIYAANKEENILTALGLDYDKEQDIFYYTQNPWQKRFGYCELYDELAPLANIIIDCEPVYFDYNGRKWLIEFWKGQYGLASGGEIGIYSTAKTELNIKGLFSGTYYESTSHSIDMNYKLIKNGKVLYKRKDIHWWLTGFVLGEYSEPEDLSMQIEMTFIDTEMMKVFVGAIENMDFENITQSSNMVKFVYNHSQDYIRYKNGLYETTVF